MSKRTLKEMIKCLNILSYNEHDIVESTWFDKDNNIKGIKHKPRTFEEDLEMDSEEYDEKKLSETFIHVKDPINSFGVAGSEYDSMVESDSSNVTSSIEEKPLIIKKSKIINNNPTSSIEI